MRRVPLVIRADHPAFPGHFPTRPIVPGAVLLDLGVRAIAALRPLHAPYRIASAKFLSMVGPGEAVTLEFDDDAGPSGALRIRIVAGDAPDERLAMTGAITPGAS